MRLASLAALVAVLTFAAPVQAQNCGFWSCFQFTAVEIDDAHEIAKTANAYVEFWLTGPFGNSSQFTAGPYPITQFGETVHIGDYEIPYLDSGSNPLLDVITPADFPSDWHSFAGDDLVLLNWQAIVRNPGMNSAPTRVATRSAHLGGHSRLGTLTIHRGLFLLSQGWTGSAFAPWQWSVNFGPQISAKFLPEPSTLFLLGFGMLCCISRSRRHSRTIPVA